MGKSEAVQIRAGRGGCLYIYDLSEETWSRLCAVKSADELPASVKNKVQAVQRSTVKAAALNAAGFRERA